MPKVSIIVPVYNVEKYIEKCLESLVNQTLQDIEIIIVNDGSTDNSEEVIKKYLEKCEIKSEKEIKYVTKKNGGLSDARNYGLQFATGDYVAFLDSDDYVDVTLYEKMYKKAVEENCDFVECDFIWKYDFKEVKDTGYIYINKFEMLAYARVVAWNKLIKRTLIEENKISFPKGLRYEDIEFFYKLLPYINKFGFIKEHLIYYVQRDNSIANTQNERNKEIFTVLDNVIKYYKENNFYDEYYKELEYAYTRLLLCSSFLRIVNIKNRKTRKQLLKATWENLNRNFPNWKKNEILLTNNSKKNIYMRSVNKISFIIYGFIFKMKSKFNYFKARV